MATLLSLVNDVERESGTVAQGQRLASVSGASGWQEQVVKWVVRAWEDIQRSRPDWIFTRKTFSTTLTIGKARYTAAELGITDFGSWFPKEQCFSPFKIYDSTIGVSDQTRVEQVDYRTWQQSFDIQSVENNRPYRLAVDWERKLCCGPAPDKAYVFSGEYRRSIQTLAADDDEPIMPADYHQAIVELALSYLSSHDEAPLQMASAQAKYRPVYGAMVRELVEAIEI